MPSRGRNFWGRVVDGVLPGHQYDRNTGQYSNIASGITGFVANQFAPGLGTLGARLWEKRQGNNQQPLPPQMLQIPRPSNGMTPPPNLQMNINPNAGQPNYGAYTNPFVAPTAPDTGNVGGFSNGVFAGGQGNFGQNYAPPSGLAGLGNTQGGARGHYSQNGLTGDAARGLFSGLSDASRFNTNFDWMPKDRNS